MMGLLWVGATILGGVIGVIFWGFFLDTGLSREESEKIPENVGVKLIEVFFVVGALLMWAVMYFGALGR